MVLVGTRWYLLGLAAAPLYQRVPTSPNSNKHNQDSNSLGGTMKPQVTGLKFPVACLKSGTKSCPSEGKTEDKAAAQRPFRSILVPKNPCCCESALDIALVPDLVPDCTRCPVALNFLLAVGFARLVGRMRAKSGIPRGRGEVRDLPLHRELLQPAQASLVTRQLGIGGVRAETAATTASGCRVLVSRYQRKRGSSNSRPA